MASKSATMPSAIGSSPWLDQENQQVAQFSAQETEDFAFSVRNELDFLNEHLAEIFSKNQVNIAEVFKTPGKLRGKTPRTARKRNPLEVREPLNNIFAPTTNPRPTSSPSRGAHPKEQKKLHVAQDATLPLEEKRMKTNTDSGYHGMTEDEMDIDGQPEPTKSSLTQMGGDASHTPSRINPLSPSREPSATEGFFHTAKKEITRDMGKELKPAQTGNERSSPVPPVQPGQDVAKASAEQRQQASSDKKVIKESGLAEKGSVLDDDIDNDSLRSPSEGSSPAVKGLVRKSSLTFAALPAREPLTTKKSSGTRHSQIDKGVVSRGSFLGRITGGKSLGGSRQPETAPETDNYPIDTDGTEKPFVRQEESDGETKAKLHNKSSTQRLHDRINMLGKSHPPRPTKSIPAAATVSDVTYPEIPQRTAVPHKMQQSSKTDDDEDDWIKPPTNQIKDSPRPQLPKSISTDVMENLRGKVNISDEDFGRQHFKGEASPRRHSSPRRSDQDLPQGASPAPVHKTASPSQVALKEQVLRSTTPPGTPVAKGIMDGPISASKSKMQSIMKTARGLFTSSASTSAQAKMELRNQAQYVSPEAQSPTKRTNTEKDIKLYPSLPTDQKPQPFQPIVRPENPAKPAEPCKTRASTEREKREKERQVAENEKQKHVEAKGQEPAMSPRRAVQDDQTIDPKLRDNMQTKTRQEPTRKSPRRAQNQKQEGYGPDAAIPEENRHDASLTKPSQPPQSSHPSQLQKPRETKRPVKPAKEAAPKPEPQRVAIRVGTLSQRIPLTNSALASGLQDSLPPPANKRPGLAKKTSSASIQTSTSNNSLRTATASKPKALLAAERKKEQDEREAQRKLEQKREMERKRAIQQEDARRQEQMQRQEAERQRERDQANAVEDPKKVAQRQAIEKRRQDLAKKEQQRVDSLSQQQAPLTSRPDLGGSRPPSKMQVVQDHNRSGTAHPAPNPAKAPIKRAFEPEAEEPGYQSRLPGGQTFQANEAKRRRTNDEASEEPVVRPTMAPPKRQSNLLRDAQRPYGPSLVGPASSMTNGYPHLKPSAVNHAHQQQYQQQPHPSRTGQAPDMAKYANGRIVFAENTNPAYPAHKTPTNQSRLTSQNQKPSPQYTNGENIQLEDIPTDSDEDSDSDEERNKKANKGAMLPSWVHSPNLNELLKEQERSQDPDSIFGPSQKVDMEEMFKERHKRFRDRTSSANWSGRDALTEEEIRTDRAARERMRREGGWTFGL